MEGGIASYQKDPRWQNNFSLGLHAEILVRVVPKQRRIEKELKMAGGKKQKGNLDPSALFTDVNNYLSAELSQFLYIVVTICLLIG